MEFFGVETNDRIISRDWFHPGFSIIHAPQETFIDHVLCVLSTMQSVFTLVATRYIEIPRGEDLSV